MTFRIATFALPLVALLAAACSSGSAASPSAAPSAALPGTSWTVTNVALAPTDATSPPTMVFGTDGTLTGTTGCNSYNGTYKVDGDSITISPLASTLMACAGAVGAQETVFVDALQKAAKWQIRSDGTLQLTGGPDTQGRYIIEGTPKGAY